MSSLIEIETEISLDDLMKIKLKKDLNPFVRDYLKNIRKKHGEINEKPLSILLGKQKKTTRPIITNKQGINMISFPMYWFKKWKSRYIAVDYRDEDEDESQAVFIRSCDDKYNSTDKLLKIGETHYIILRNDIMEKLNYPEKLQMKFYEFYLVISVPKEEKLRLQSRMKEIEKRKKNELMKNTYARLF